MKFVTNCINYFGTVRRLLSTSATSWANRASVSEDGNKVIVSCDGEPERRYHGVWLRHNCRCSQCRPPNFHKTNVFYENLKQLKLMDARVEGNNILVKWDSEVGPHSGNFSIDWLKKHDYTTPGLSEARRKLEEPLIATSLPVINYSEIAAGDEGLYKWLKQINFYGVSLIENMPAKIGVAEELCSRVHELQSHAYELVYDVLALDTADDISYTAERLMLHMDEGFFEANLGIQILHCIEFDDCVKGGESFIVDVYAVIEDLRHKHPKHFKTLCTVPYKTEKITDDINFLHHLEYQRPLIALNRDGQVIGINYSPQYSAPLAVHEDEVEDFYDAYIMFSDMIKHSPNKIEYKLRVGDVLTMSNRRMVHSRNAYSLNGGRRYLRGMYIKMDFVRSMFLVLARKYEPEVIPKRCFNNSWSA